MVHFKCNLERRYGTNRERVLKMPRQNYMTVSVSDSIQEIFNEFVRTKDLSKTAALTDVLEMYMLATDEELYWKLKKQVLHVEEVKDMIQSNQSNPSNNDIIFMKLGKKLFDGQEFDEDTTMKLYKYDCMKRDYTWFSTQSLFFGMSANKIKYYNQKIEQGEQVLILFAGNTIQGQEKVNDIGYAAEVVEVFSQKEPVACPEPQAVPAEFQGEKARIWLKLKNVRDEFNIKASMLKITSTQNDLKQVISAGQFHYGYVSFK